MIIFGSKTNPKLIATKMYKCNSCNNATWHRFVKVTEWFTIYFIPVIPFGNKLFMDCTVCGYASEIKGQAKKDTLVAIKNAKAHSSTGAIA